jgi:sucrose-6-phosphate hydrolase SacC (GH32 family)
VHGLQRLSLIRQVEYDPRLETLVSAPLPELSELHGDSLYGQTNLTLRAGASPVSLVPATQLDARAMDLQANLSLAGVTSQIDVRIGVLSPQDLLQIGQGAVLDVEVTPPAQDGSRNGTLHLWSSSYPAPALDSPHAQGGANFTQSFTVLPHEEMIDIRALVDHSSVEAFVMRGRAVISLAVVPNCTENQFARDKCAAGQVQAGVSAQSQTGATLSMACMSMHCMWVSDVDSA